MNFRHFSCLFLLVSATARHASPARYVDVTRPPCGADNSGSTDATRALQGCIQYAYNLTVPAVPLFFPAGVYLLSDTLAFHQLNGAKFQGDDGINVVPARLLPHIALGAKVGRAILRLAPSSPGFGNATAPKPVVKIWNGINDNINMNNLFRSFDLDLTAPGNPGAAGLYFAGSQGACASDVAVTAASDAFACFLGVNGAGGGHLGTSCRGARYGFYVHNSTSAFANQAGATIANATLSGQSVSAIFYDKEPDNRWNAGNPTGTTLSLVGVEVEAPPGAAGPAIDARQTLTAVDVSVVCGGGGGGGSVAIAARATVFLRDVWVSGCSAAVLAPGNASLPGPPHASTLHVAAFAKGADVPGAAIVGDVVYVRGARVPGGVVNSSAVVAGGAAPRGLADAHGWGEASFFGPDSPGVADAVADCGAAGDGATDDTAALQACLSAHPRVLLPPGVFRVSATLEMRPGGALVGMGNGASIIAAASGGLPRATAALPAPLLRTAEDGGAQRTVVALLGLVTWHHLPHVFTLEWASRAADSVWGVNFEARACECLWVSAWQAVDPPLRPCKLPTNLTVPKSLVRGVGKFFLFVNDEVGAILSTGAAYRHLAVRDTARFASPSARTRFYGLNLEHCQSEACAEVRNASWVDVFVIKSEGNLPVLWVRGDAHNVSVLGLTGGFTPFSSNYTYPPDFEQRLPSYVRVDSGARGVTLAAFIDQGYGAVPDAPYWPPLGGGCAWGAHYPYPGEAVPLFPFGTWPNATMFNCWFGSRVSNFFTHLISVGDVGSAPRDRPAYFSI
jgi:hypothetical protein